ncbi:MAG: hypothetical protein K0R54_785 [Clostridiaceae bacterium]|jgi:hypothetical protein|nr:hypothetical protein [Clostridiaceae bacterium]
MNKSKINIVKTGAVIILIISFLIIMFSFNKTNLSELPNSQNTPKTTVDSEDVVNVINQNGEKGTVIVTQPENYEDIINTVDAISY